MSFNSRMIHYTNLTPPDAPKATPNNAKHFVLSYSLDYFGAGTGWLTLKRAGGEIDLAPEDQRELLFLLAERMPLEALASIKPAPSSGDHRS